MLSSAESSVESSHAARESRATSLHRVVWRWHFYAGLFVAPVLFVIALTGAIYIFKDDVEPWLYPSLLVVEPRSEAVPLETLVQAAESAAGANSRATFLTVFAEPTRSAKIAVRTSEGGRKKSRSYFVDPYTGQVLGPTPWFDFFEIVRTIHRRLFLSTIGRLIVELATSWAIVLFATGVYLWRPRKLSQVAGVWRPRPNPKPYAALRDIHALAGVYLLPITLTIALTGLLYSSMVGWFFDQAAEATHAYAVFTPPQSPSPAEARSLSLDAAVAHAKTHFAADSAWSLTLPEKPGAAWLFSEMTSDLHQYRRVVALDRATGEVVSNTPEAKFPVVLWWQGWNYPLHVGSVLGWPTKLLWLVACLVLMLLPITGFLMWRQRKPPDAWGAPRRSVGRLPLWLMGVIAVVALLLPAVGLSVVAILTYERFALRAPRRV